jgi:hypothetical protein
MNYSTTNNKRNVICTSNYSDYKIPITIGNKYEIIEEQTLKFSIPERERGPFYLIIDDNKFQRWIIYSNFRELTIQEKREEKLNSLLNTK